MLQVIPHVVGLVALCADFIYCQCTKLIHFLTCTRIPCRDSHCVNGRVRCEIYTPRRLQQTAVSCKRSNCNRKILKVDTQTMPFPYHVLLSSPTNVLIAHILFPSKKFSKTTAILGLGLGSNPSDGLAANATNHCDKVSNQQHAFIRGLWTRY